MAVDFKSLLSGSGIGKPQDSAPARAVAVCAEFTTSNDDYVCEAETCPKLMPATGWLHIITGDETGDECCTTEILLCLPHLELARNFAVYCGLADNSVSPPMINVRRNLA